MTKIIAFHGDPAIQEKYLSRVRTHREADELVQRIGWNGHKGCAVGCTLERYDHEGYEIELGIPQALARIEDAIFEGLPPDQALLWPERFLAAIQPGSDLAVIHWQFLHWILTELRAA